MATNAVNTNSVSGNCPGSVRFGEKAPGMPFAIVESGGSRAEISLYGGQLLSFIPKGGQDLLFMSSRSFFAPGKAIRGGVPICWPWFGPFPGRPDLPAHGFVRTAMWEFESAGECAEGMRIALATSSTPATKALWPHDFRLRLELTVGKSARLELAMTNTGSGAFDVTCAFHPYFRVGEAGAATVLGLEGCLCHDRLPGGGESVQQGGLRLDSLADRLYDCAGVKSIADPVLGRTIELRQEGFPSTVVWNPWEEKARGMADMGEGEYRTMLCVEPARVGADAIALGPGGTASLSFSFGNER